MQHVMGKTLDPRVTGDGHLPKCRKFDVKAGHASTLTHLITFVQACS